MATKTRKKEYLQTDVYQEALERTRFLFNRFDKIVVSFSGGKDSTAVLNVALEVAREMNRLPLEVVFFDEEVIHPPTIEYVRRVSQRPDVNLKWYCLEVKHRNACSNEEPFWYAWDSEKKDKWVRDLPPEAITHHPKFKKGMSFQELGPYLYDRTEGSIGMLTGIRTQESLRRFQVIAKKKNDAFVNSKAEKRQNQYRAFPIYDWSSEDVWLAVAKYGWDYNRTYDIFNQTKLYQNYLGQRVCPPFGEEPLRGLWIYAECFPDMFHKMLGRVDGVATAWRYANSELYANAKEKPDNMPWSKYIEVILDSYSREARKQVANNIHGYMNLHRKKTSQPIPEENPHPLSGVSYKWLARVAIRGDFKSRQSNTLNNQAVNARTKLGISYEEALKKYS